MRITPESQAHRPALARGLPLVLAGVVAALASACASSRTVATPGSPLGATSAVRVNVINLNNTPAGFILRFGGVQLYDTIAPPGSLPVPVMSQTIRVGPGMYQVQLLDRRSGKVSQTSVEMSGAGNRGFATIEIRFDSTESYMEACHCVRLYGGGG